MSSQMIGAPAAIATRALCKSFGRRPVVVDLDLVVRVGEVFGFLGPNGAGKSTTIRMLLDLLRPTSGEVLLLGGNPRADGPELRRQIGYLPGDFAIHDRQSVDEALTGLARLRGGVPRARIVGLAQRLELDLRRTIRELSTGNRQKVGLVQAFMHDPELVILDEPTDGLDPLLRHQVAQLITEVSADGRTVLLSSHDLSEVQATADRVGMIRGGELVAVDTVQALRERAVHQVEIEFDDIVTAADFGGVAGLTGVTVAAGQQGWVLRGSLIGAADALIKVAAGHTVRTIRVQEPDLEKVFLALYAGGPDASR